MALSGGFTLGMGLVGLTGKVSAFFVGAGVGFLVAALLRP